MMTINWSCWTTGDDTTGDGTAGTPYKTITKASTGLSGGDEVRVSKSPAHTALSGTLSFTDGSTSVGTSTDLTAVLAATNLIGKDADDGMWYEIASLNSTTITLVGKYSGTTNAAATAYKMGFHDLGSPAGSTTALQTVSASGSSASSLLKISGGWDLSTQTQTARSYSCTTHSTNRNGYGLYALNRNYIEISDIINCRCYRAFSITGITVNQSKCEGYANGQDPIFNLGAANSLIEDCKAAVGSYGGFKIDAFGITLNNIRSDSQTATGYAGIDIRQYGAILKNITARNNAGRGIYSYFGSLFGKLTLEKNGTGIEFNSDYGIAPANIGSLIANNNTTAVSFIYGGTVIIGSLTLSGNTTDFNVSSTYFGDCQWPYAKVQRWADAHGDSRMLYRNGVVYRDTAEARSGACIKADPSSATASIWVSLGKYLVTSDDADLTISIYAKDDVAFNGDVKLMALMNGQVAVLPTAKTMDTSYGAHTLVVDTDDLVENEWLELIAMVRGTTGNVYFDDFSVS